MSLQSSFCALSRAATSALRPPACLAGVSAMAGAVRRYSENVHEHFQHPRNVGSFKKGEEHVGTAIVGKAACGDVIKLQVKIEEGVIKDAKFKTFGCGSAIASSSYATELIKGKTPEEAMQLKNTDIADYLKLPPVKIHCSLLAEDAVRHAIEDYQKKYPGVTEATIAADEGPTSHQQQMGAA